METSLGEGKLNSNVIKLVSHPARAQGFEKYIYSNFSAKSGDAPK